MKMQWNVKFVPALTGWVVEAVGSEGEVYVSQFYGPEAEERAKEYAAFKSAG